jgi:Protein of unknown function (DUF3106)
MTSRMRILKCLAALLAAACLAQLHGSELNRVAPAGADTPKHVGKSPVDTFRYLLAMPPQERREYLTNWPEATRKLLMAKVREYQSLRSEQRELRLRATELRYYLLPLMTSPPTNRVAQLAKIPAEDRPLVSERIKEWDQLSPPLQSELLTNEATLQFYSHLQAGETNKLESMPASKRKVVQEGIDHWQKLSEEQRSEIAQRFEDFFTLSVQEQAQTLHTLSEPERQQIEKTLNAFKSLPALKRIHCIASFKKFASLSPEERQEFLKNAARWQLMKPSERQAWRNLVSMVQAEPPMPIPLSPPRPHLPHPLPVRTNTSTSTHGTAVATNQ